MKGSYTVEGAFLFPVVILAMALVMRMGLVLYDEIRNEDEAKEVTGISHVEDFYTYQIIGEIIDEFK